MTYHVRTYSVMKSGALFTQAKNVPEEHNGEFGYGDVWTFTAIDADTKLVPCWKVGTRDAECASEFIADLKDRLSNPSSIHDRWPWYVPSSN